jgi:hypothetical protein
MKGKLGQALVSMICLLLAWKMTDGLEGSEFGGGTITGPVLSMVDAAILFFLLSLLLVFWLRRASALLTGVGCLLCLPLNLPLLAPGPFRRIALGQWSVALQSNFVLSRWTLGWALALLLGICISLMNFVKAPVTEASATELRQR